VKFEVMNDLVSGWESRLREGWPPGRDTCSLAGKPHGVFGDLVAWLRGCRI